MTMLPIKLGVFVLASLSLGYFSRASLRRRDAHGHYRYIRHPLYSSLLFLAWGACCKHLTWGVTGMALLATIFLTMTARTEEDENLRSFGPAYQASMQRTRRFIPWLF